MTITSRVYNTYQNIWLAHEITKYKCVNVEESGEESANVGSVILFIEGCFISSEHHLMFLIGDSFFLRFSQKYWKFMA